MKEIAKLKLLPPVYIGKWASATDARVQEGLAKGSPYTYQFRVSKERSLKISDLIRGEHYLQTSKMMPAGIVARISALMTGFYLYKIVTGGNYIPVKAE